MVSKRLLAASAAAAAAAVLAAVMAAQPEPGEIVYESIENRSMNIQPIMPLHNASASPQQRPAPVPRGIADANNGFAVDFYRQVSDSGQNIFFSPASIYTAFSLLYEGAGGETASQMQNVLGFEPDTAARHDATAQMMASLNYEDGYTAAGLSNALWLADWFEPYDDYLDITRGTYLADVQKVDFADADDGVRRINDWAAEKTRDKIRKIISENDVGAETEMVLTNAIYFKGEWIRIFPEEHTHKSEFLTGGGTYTEADFMRTSGQFYYAESDGAQALILPYKGERLAMLAILPAERGGLAALEEAVTAEQIGMWAGGRDVYDVQVTMPKFEMDTGYDLREPLGSLGMTEVFGPAADLGGIAPGDLFVSGAMQKAHVRVDEKGTEAAAVTTAINMQRSYPDATFTADHPFLFTIYDVDSGMILFMGRVSDPTA